MYHSIIFWHILSPVYFSTTERLTDVKPLIACPYHVEHVVKYGADPFVSTDGTTDIRERSFGQLSFVTSQNLGTKTVSVHHTHIRGQKWHKL